MQRDRNMPNMDEETELEKDDFSLFIDIVEKQCQVCLIYTAIVLSTFGLAQSGINMQPEIGITQSKAGVKPARPLEEGNAPKKMNDFVAALNLEKETPTGLTAYNAPNAAEFLMKHKPSIEKKARKEAKQEKPIQTITPWEGPMEGRPKGGGRGKEFEGGNAGSDWWYSPEVGGRGKEPVAEGRPKKTKGNRRPEEFHKQWPPIQLFNGGIG